MKHGRAGTGKQYDLFRAVIRASGAFPGLFPPVRLRLGARGQQFFETHVDGGVQMQVLATPAAAYSVTSNAARLLGKTLGLGFSAAWVRPDSCVIYDPNDRFSVAYMAALYEHGYERAVSSALWER